MFYKFSGIFFFLGVLLFYMAILSVRSTPSIQSILIGVTQGKPEIFLCIITFITILGVLPMLLVCFLFLKTSGLVYVEVDDLVRRLAIYGESFTLHCTLMIFLHGLLTYTNVNSDYMGYGGLEFTDIVYSTGIFTTLIVLLSTAMRIPLVIFVFEYYIFSYSSFPTKPLFRRTFFPLVISSALALSSLVVDYKFDRLYRAFIARQYNGANSHVDTFTDTCFSTTLYSCLYASVLNYYGIC